MREDIKKKHKKIYDSSTRFVSEVKVPEFQFVMIDGIGNPSEPDFMLKSKALNLISHAIRNKLKADGNGAYLIAPLEGVWDTYDNSKFDVTRKKMIRYTLMMAQPKEITTKIFEEVKAELISKKDNSYINDSYLKKWEEGNSVQMLHIGSYDTEIISTKQIMEYIIIQNLKLNGLHHEIYLNNPNRVEPSKLKTIIRYPVADDI
jgi:Uncharacterized conserved protein